MPQQLTMSTSCYESKTISANNGNVLDLKYRWPLTTTISGPRIPKSLLKISGEQIHANIQKPPIHQLRTQCSKQKQELQE